MKINGIIEAKKLGKSGEGQYGPWQVYEFTIDGERYSTFKKKLYDVCNVGDSVEITGEQTEKGFNVQFIHVTDAKPEVVKIPGGTIVGPVIKTNGNGSMYASYAKDVFNILQQRENKDLEGNSQNTTQIMQTAINLVKQAKEAFE